MKCDYCGRNAKYYTSYNIAIYCDDPKCIERALKAEANFGEAMDMLYEEEKPEKEDE